MLRGLLFLLCLPFLFSQAPSTQAPDDTATLTKQVQNPVASLISVPVQNLTDFNIGPYKRDKNTVLQFQPVVPINLTKDWNLILRVIAPVISQPDISQPHLGTFGLGDMNPTFYFSPAKPGKLIWGAGPSFSVPTATDDNLGTGKFSLGPSVVALTQPGKWTLGALATNVWSVAGPAGRPDVNSFLLQYFVNYNLPKGYFITFQPIITTNWEASAGNRWLVPWGGGLARIFRLGAQPMNASVQAYWYGTRYDTTPSPTWQLKFQIAFLFPKK